MLQPVNRLRYKVFTSFAIALCAFLGIARLAAQTQVSTQAMFVYAILAVLATAGIWRGLIYLRGVREMG
ncbi:MAG TPA: hypothetical protein VII69_10270 [Candidatus Eremiobacteraceae bacterium]